MAASERFLAELWRLVIDEERGAANPPSSAAEQRLLRAGADPDDLLDAIRVRQVEVLVSVCELLDDPSLSHIQLDHYRWQLMAAPTGSDRWVPMYSLHTEFLEADPTGRDGHERDRPVPVSLPGAPEYVRRAVAQALAGDRTAALRTWRHATDLPITQAAAALDQALRDFEADQA